jgi:hypothetical protein
LILNNLDINCVRTLFKVDFLFRSNYSIFKKNYKMKQNELANKLQSLRIDTLTFNHKPIKGLNKDRLKYLGIYLLQNFSLQEIQKSYILSNLGIDERLTSRSEISSCLEKLIESKGSLESCELLLRSYEVIIKGISDEQLTDEHFQYINFRIDEIKNAEY